jgi:type I restriction enzyme S subunit
VEKLDSLTTASTEARTALTRVETLVEQYRQALPSAYFRALEKRGTERKPFFEVLDYKGGTQPPKSEFQHELGENLIRLLQIRDFSSDDKAVYIPDSPKWSKCRSDDILIGRYGASIGRVLTGKAGAYNVALVKVLFDRETFAPSFVRHWLMSSEFQSRLLALSRTAQNGFNKQDLADLTVPVPALSSQDLAIAEIEEAFAQIDTLASAARSARERLDKLDRAVLAKAFRGELVPQDPKDEPASELLKRLQKETV